MCWSGWITIKVLPGRNSDAIPSTSRDCLSSNDGELK
ncbi:hypothetical protein EHYA_03874 [Embleya hyalina]|uniref:Uncharacterized protein n=1 Tax=Embleya hyalina TaxID=516124 RepID=A0A401YNJ6_9ACTN|nr:hypothetical protein EHYA_03874 [Embleya hyalina]